jgi:hypothetical protein
VLHLQYTVLGLFWRQGFTKYLPELVSDLSFPDLSLPSS